MTTEDMIRALGNVIEEYKNKPVFTGQTDIPMMCRDVIDKLKELTSTWHTGIPTEEGWYLIEAKDWEKQRVYYVPDYVSVHDLVLPTVQTFFESHLWQKIELSDEAKDLEKKDNSIRGDKENEDGHID